MTRARLVTRCGCMRDMDFSDGPLDEVRIYLRHDVRAFDVNIDARTPDLMRRFERRYQAGDGVWVYHEVAE